MSDWQNQLGDLVYSTEGGRIEKSNSQPEFLGESFADGKLRLSRETKGRKGKGVTIISGLQLAPDEFKEMAKKIKKKCGTGGAVKEGTIEIQGDDREKIKSVLESLGFQCKIAGG